MNCKEWCPWVNSRYIIIIIIINKIQWFDYRLSDIRWTVRNDVPGSTQDISYIIINKTQWFDYRLSDIRWTVRNDVPGSTQDISLLLLLIKHSDLIIVCLILDEL